MKKRLLLCFLALLILLGFGFAFYLIKIRKIGQNSSDETKISADGNVILLGDSRTVGMYFAKLLPEDQYGAYCFTPISDNFIADLNGITFCAKGGEEYDWFSDVAVPLISDRLTPGTTVVVCFGVNDPQRYEDYAAFLNRFAAEHSEVRVYMCTVGYVNSALADVNANITAFNQAMRTELGGQVSLIDLCSFMQEGLENQTFAMLDNYHYNARSSAAAFDYIMDCIGYNVLN